MNIYLMAHLAVYRLIFPEVNHFSCPATVPPLPPFPVYGTLRFSFHRFCSAAPPAQANAFSTRTPLDFLSTRGARCQVVSGSHDPRPAFPLPSPRGPYYALSSIGNIVPDRDLVEAAEANGPIHFISSTVSDPPTPRHFVLLKSWLSFYRRRASV